MERPGFARRAPRRYVAPLPPLDPIVSEFASTDEEEAYDLWFRTKVQTSLDDPSPPIPHDAVMAELRELLSAKQAARDAGTHATRLAG